MKIALVALLALPIAAHAQPLSPAEKAAGWVSLFDGSGTGAWRGYRQDAFPAQGWEVKDGWMTTTGGGGDIITRAEYADFELTLEWKAAKAANSGIMYRVTERHDATWQTGPEYQILDDAGYGAGNTDMHSAGALYDLAAPAPEKVLRPAGEVNHARIVMKDGRLEHWLNGVRVVECRTDDATWAERIGKSKFNAYAGFGVEPKGHIAIQDHGDSLSFRNIRIRDLDAPMPGEVALFDGGTLKGWKGFLPGGEPADRVWSVCDGAMVCAGNPVGYIHTEKSYDNFVLKLEWRYLPGREGNSGVLVRQTGEHKVWPTSVEAQLQSGSAGDFWNIGEFAMKTDPARLNGRNTRRTATNERPVGEWNEYEIIVDHADVVLIVNGMELNRAWDVEELAGPIALQSEGAEIHFRNIRLAPIGGR